MGITENGSATSRELGCPHPDERACASAPAKSRERARVSKDEDATTWPSCFETHRSARRLWEQLPSHSAAMLLSMRARREASTPGCTKRPPAQLHCLRI